MNLFDRKFGKGYLASVPTAPGVYSWYAEDGTLLYVGKAKNLRRRLSQYRKAKRGKRGKKMRALVKEGVRVEWQVHATELEASLQELRDIQQRRPARNIVGTFTHLYPMIGVRERDTDTTFCFTTSADKLSGFEFHGAYRSRETTAEAFFALMELLHFVGHPVPRHALGVAEIPQYTYLFGFRRLPAEWPGHWRRFLLGESPEALEILVFKLLDNAGARAKASEVQEQVKLVDRFWEREVVPLRRVIAATAFVDYPVPPTERDLLFVRAGFLEREVSS